MDRGDTCKFKIRIAKTKEFHCAIIHGADGYLYSYDKANSPCALCKKYSSGKPVEVTHWLKPASFWFIAGEIITTEDWKWM